MSLTAEGFAKLDELKIEQRRFEATRKLTTTGLALTATGLILKVVLFILNVELNSETIANRIMAWLFN